MNCKNCGYGLKQSCGDFEKIICTYEDGECVKITELEQENAELKDDNKVMADNYSKMEQKFYDNLTKAKEHIENLLYYTKQCTCERSNYAEIEKDIKEAAQFLQGVSE